MLDAICHPAGLSKEQKREIDILYHMPSILNAASAVRCVAMRRVVSPAWALRLGRDATRQEEVAVCPAPATWLLS
jgi:hypothetical protein